MTERDKVLERIREGLRAPAQPTSGHEAHRGALSLEPERFRKVLPSVANSFEQRLELFARCAADLKAQFHRVQKSTDAADLLQTLEVLEKWNGLALHKNPLVESAVGKLAGHRLYVDAGYDLKELEKCSVGISACDALVAQTGSVLVTSRSAGGRALSVLPPHHVVLAFGKQLMADLPEAFALLKEKYASEYPSFISFITGPSRTGDIERILVLGAHGPKKLTILCC